MAFRILAPELNNTEFGLYYIDYHSRVPLFSGIRGGTTNILTGGPFDPATGKGTYFAEYPENINLFGFSFNTAGPEGIALQGEYSYRSNVPIQYATTELLLAALGAPNLITGSTQIPGQPTGVTPAALVPVGTYLQGYQRLKASQFQMTATKSQPSVLGAEQLVVVGELGYTYFHRLSEGQKYNGPSVHLPATLLGALASGAFSVQEDGFLTKSSWGYRLVGRLEYNNALYGGNISPRLAWSHDVSGVSPTFNEGVKSVSVGAAWDYQRKWLVDIQYTNYFGGRTYCGTDAAPPSAIPPGQSASFCSSANPIKDRDFYSLSVSYSF
jgi:hypothetical protein